VTKKVSKKSRQTHKKSTEPVTKQGREAVRMVALGASAGGLEPFERFFDAMPVDSGLAFVLVQHLSPDFESMMDELLARHSDMAIRRVVHDLKVEANTIYLNPPRSDMIVKDGAFKLNPRPDSKQLNLPIDIFFASMAEEYKDKSIGIVLSGTGSDGTRGTSIIKEHGGTVIVQTPNSAKFEGMPRSVIDNGFADAVAVPSEIPTLIGHLLAGRSLIEPDLSEIADDPARYAFGLLRDKFGTDFGYYKEATLIRRFERRAQLSGHTTEDYAKTLTLDVEELDALYADLLIDVTSFFRDKKAFGSVIEKVVEPLGKKMTHDRQIRVWVPGCSSGEEAYSLAIAFAEYARRHNLPLNLKILATDVHQRSLGAAAQGIYPKSSLGGLSDEQVERYFDKHVDYYQINPNLRRLVVFSQHNLLRDPPFTRIDFVSCRNVLIYFQEKAQEKTLALFHFALSVNGYLFLGPSESLSKLEDEFKLLDRRWNIYRKLRDVRLIEATSLLPRNSTTPTTTAQEMKQPFLTGRTATLQRFQRAHGEALEILLKRYGPSGFLLNKDGEIVHVFGQGGDFVKIDGGIFSNRIIDLIDPQLGLAITTGLERVSASEKLTYQRRVILTYDNKPDKSVLVSMESLSEKNQSGNHILLTFESPREVEKDEAKTAKFLDTNETSHIMQQRIYDLERDLKSTEQSLQSMVEELQTSNEELQATNEELMASNEELQSTNEELHSVNEELYTVSAEHQRKIDELTVLTDDMNHLLRATSIGILFLDENERIRRFTPSATAVFNLMGQDIGRPFEHTTYRFSNVNLREAMDEVRASQKPSEHEIDVDGKHYLLSILPYTTSVKNASGIVLTIVDITDWKTAEKERRAQQEIFKAVVSDLSESISRVRLEDGAVVLCNDLFAELYGKTVDDVVGSHLSQTVGKNSARKTLDLVKGQKPGATLSSHFTLNRGQKDEKIIHRRIRVIGDEKGTATAFQAASLDVTEQYRYSEALEALIAVEDTPGLDFDEAIDRILQIGCDYFQLNSGQTFRIEDKSAIIEHLHGDIAKLAKKGQAFAFSSTFHGSLSDERDPLAFSNLSESKFKDKALYNYKAFQSYIGVRTMTSRGLYGILSFAGEERSHKEFSAMECTMIQLLAQYVGALMERKLQYAALEIRRSELESVNEGLNRFTYLASHDLQEPLRKIQQSGEFLNADYGHLLEDEGAYFLKIMRDSAGRMRSLIDDLLLYSTSANQPLDTHPISFKTLIEDAKSDMSDKIKETKAKVSISSMPTILCDAAVMKQVILNILGNSLKYRTPDKRPEIKISSRKTKSETHISLCDNGIGLEEKNLGNIFDPFVRLHSKNEYDGSGIGLAICKSVCDRHGWTISAEQNDGGGTCIRIGIPNSHVE
jgi:two-component system CheB/CheR fusion protein